MNIEKNNNFPWDTLETTNLMNPLEVIAFHIYKLTLETEMKKEKNIKKSSMLLASYLESDMVKKEEKLECSQK